MLPGKKGLIGVLSWMVLTLGGVVSAATVNTWQGTTASWDTGSNWSTTVTPLATDDVVLPNGIPSGGASITLTAGGEVANSLTIKNNYSLTGGDLTLTTGAVSVDMGYVGTINTKLTGGNGLTKTGGGTLILTNASNDYTGTTTVNGGILAAQAPGALNNAEASAIVVTGSNTPGVPGGQLVYGGGYASTTWSRSLQLSGYGTLGTSQAFASVGNNAITGNIATSTTLNTRLASLWGNATVSGNVNMGSPTGAVYSIFSGGWNWNITGSLQSGNANPVFEKQGTGTLVLAPTAGNNNGFTGNIRLTGGFLQVIDNNYLGAGTGAASIDFNGGTLNARMDSPNFSTRNVSFATGNGTVFVDRLPGGSAINQTVTFGDTVLGASTLTVTGRDGFATTFTNSGGTIGVGTAAGNTTLTNSSNGTVTYNAANLWNQADAATARTLTIGGTGDSVVTGSILASGAAHVVTKANPGTVTIQGTSSTYTGNTNISAGTLAIYGFGSINGASGTLNIGNATTTSGTLNYLGSGETTTKAINFNTTTANTFLYANHAGATPLILNGTLSAVAGAKTLFFGGSSVQDNEIRAALPNVAANFQKTGTGTWLLTAANLYTGSTTISAGTLKANDTFSGGSRNVIPDGSAIIFNADTFTQTAGGIFNYNGAASSASTESVGALTPTAGAGTVRVVPGSGGTAALTFASLGTVANGTSVNVENTGTVNITGTAGFMNAHLYYGGSDFAFSGSGTTLRAPILWYGHQLHDFVDRVDRKQTHGDHGQFQQRRGYDL